MWGFHQERSSERLDDGDHAGPSPGLIDGSSRHLADGLKGESCELPQKLSMIEPIGHEGRRRESSRGAARKDDRP